MLFRSPGVLSHQKEGHVCKADRPLEERSTAPRAHNGVRTAPGVGEGLGPELESIGGVGMDQAKGLGAVSGVLFPGRGKPV